MTDFYNKTGCKVISAMETPWVYCNDNLTPDEKQAYYDDTYEWFFAVCEDLENNRRSMMPDYNVVYLEDYLK